MAILDSGPLMLSLLCLNFVWEFPVPSFHVLCLFLLFAVGFQLASSCIYSRKFPVPSFQIHLSRHCCLWPWGFHLSLSLLLLFRLSPTWSQFSGFLSCPLFFFLFKIVLSTWSPSLLPLAWTLLMSQQTFSLQLACSMRLLGNGK